MKILTINSKNVESDEQKVELLINLEQAKKEGYTHLIDDCGVGCKDTYDINDAIQLFKNETVDL